MPADGSVHTVSFSVHAGGFTRLVRDRVLERRWDWSWNALMEGLDGMTADIAIRILKGDAKLSDDGPGGMTLEEDDDQKYKAELNYLFGGVFMLDGRYMQPYAVVTSWGIEDFRGSREIAPGSDVVTATSMGTKRYTDHTYGEVFDIAYRSVFYADDPKRDIVRLLPMKGYSPMRGYVQDSHSGYVLFKEITGYPVMLFGIPPLDAGEALKRYREAGGRLSEVGYQTSWPKEIFNRRVDCTAPTLEPQSIGVIETHYESEEQNLMREEAAKAANKIAEQVRKAGDREKWLERQNREAIARIEFEKDMARWRVEIDAQAAGDYFELKWEEDGEQMSAMVPTAPFENWSVWRTDGAHLAKPWTPVCPSGLKMMGDDPYHTDWITGAGLGLDWMSDLNGPRHRAAWDARDDAQERLLGFKVGVLCGEGRAEGKVVHVKKGQGLPEGCIGIIRNAGPDYVQAAYDAIKYGTALITENGGSMAHLVTVGRGEGLRLVRVPDARKAFPEGVTVSVNCTRGEVTLQEGKHKMLVGGIGLF